MDQKSKGQTLIKPRCSAVRILEDVLYHQNTVERAVSREKDYDTYSDADRHFIQLLVLTTLRRMGQIDAVLGKVIHKKIPQKNHCVLNILRLSVAQLVWLNTPEYAVVDTAVAMVRAFHFNVLTGFVNAVLRSLMRLENMTEGCEGCALNVPKWMWESWKKVYGVRVADSICEAILDTPPLDITVCEHREVLAKKWNGVILPTGSIRVQETNPERLDGFLGEKAWVQNAAASVPAQLFCDVRGKTVADLCAAPGGKTAQLVARGAKVVACDISEKRLARLRENMARLGFKDYVKTRVGDVMDLPDEAIFDAILLDAPCSATGTVARHPEMKYHRTADDVARLADMQRQLLEKAVRLVRTGGEIVFSTCSLQPEEGDSVVQSVSGIEVVRPKLDWLDPFLTPFGSLRFLPSQGYDGFYACLLRKK